MWSTGEIVAEDLTIDTRTFTSSAAYDDTFLTERLVYPGGVVVDMVRDDEVGRLSGLHVQGQPVWSQQYSGLRRGGGSSGALATGRAYDLDARPRSFTAALGDSPRQCRVRSYAVVVGWAGAADAQAVC